MAGSKYDKPVQAVDDTTVAVGSKPVPDNDGDGDDPVTNLGDICPGIENQPGR